MIGAPQATTMPGPVEYRRKYTLWVLILLVIVCWPAAILYYFTRDKVPVQELHTYMNPYQQPMGSPPAPMWAGRFCASCGTSNAPGAAFCARCGKSLG